MIIYDYVISAILITLFLAVLLATIAMVLYVLTHDLGEGRRKGAEKPRPDAQTDPEDDEWEEI